MILEIGKRYRNITRNQVVELKAYDEFGVQVISSIDGELYWKPRYVFYQLYRLNE